MAQAVGEGGFFAGAFGTMKFPKYKYQEYPKRITAPDGTRVRVVDASDELRVKATLPAERPQTEVERERDHIMVERDDLAKVVAAKDAELAKLREMMAQAQAMPNSKQAPEPTPPAPVVVAPAAKKST